LEYRSKWLWSIRGVDIQPSSSKRPWFSGIQDTATGTMATRSPLQYSSSENDVLDVAGVSAPDTAKPDHGMVFGVRVPSPGLGRFRMWSGGDAETMPASARGRLAAIAAATVELERWKSLLLGEVDKLWVWPTSRR
jgi:hypothetical protein